MKVKLGMVNADDTRRVFLLRKGRVLIGRTHACDLRIPSSSVSRKHCEVLLDGETVKLRDLGSLNGTLRNGEGILETVELTAGDRITIGPIVITLVIDDEPNQVDEERVQLHIDEDDTEAP